MIPGIYESRLGAMNELDMTGMFRIGQHRISINLHVLITINHVGYVVSRHGTVITSFSFNVTVEEEKSNHLDELAQYFGDSDEASTITERYGMTKLKKEQRKESKPQRIALDHTTYRRTYVRKQHA